MPYPAKPVPQAKTVTPFSTNASSSGIGHFIVYRPLEQMSRSDRDLAAKTQPAIRDAAAFVGIDFDKEKWRYRELECQALPGHLFLLFAGDSGVGDASLFSVAILRAGKGRVRAIPVERRGFSLSRRLQSTYSPWRSSIAFARRNRQVRPPIGFLPACASPP